MLQTLGRVSIGRRGFALGGGMNQSRGEDKPLARQPQVPRQSRGNAGSEDPRSKQGANLQPDSSGSSVDEARRDRPNSHPPPELDFYSWHFNALAALYTPGLMPPMK